MPYLQKYRTVMAVNFIGHPTPALPLGFCVDAGRQGVAFAGWRNVGGLRHDQAGTGPLPIIGTHQFIGDIAIGRPRASHGRQDNAILQRNDAAKDLRFEQVGHMSSFDWLRSKAYFSVVAPSTHRLVSGEQMKIINKLPGLPGERALAVLSGRWKAVILYVLLDGPQRTCELEKRIAGISQKVLIEQLRALEEHGVVSRQPSAGDSQGIEYLLTPLGASLRPILDSLIEWGAHHAKELDEVHRLLPCDAVVRDRIG
jgi:DNA-binding HxlR family transcriptional regulator